MKRHLKARFVSSLHSVSFLKLIDTSTGINQLLLTCKERVAIAANIHLQNVPFLRGTRLESRTASADNRYFVIFGMYISFHSYHLAVSFFPFKCFLIIAFFFHLVNCFYANLQKIVANLLKMRYTDFKQRFSPRAAD